ncbi:hypothetical protein Clacol_010214 [Clathrus columnatus]|uniref:Uncharacterized protein n=1 Tax=Clathrus columnatus TaxID=1419009 RepID=A0AAV5AT73_9AGAM|nr:hypothetical protein Clacol_010214 [Clathrus columnatus]
MYIRSIYPDLPDIPKANYHNVLFRSPGAQALPDYVMYICAVTGRKLKRFEFIERVYNAATALGASKDKGGLGLDSKCMVGVLSDNCLDYMIIIHALLAITTPMALFSSHGTPREIQHFLGTSRATHVFVHASILDTFLLVAKDVGFPEENIFILEGTSSSKPKLRPLDTMINDVVSLRIPREPVRNADNDTLAYLMFSSGTTGLPKAIMISHGNLIASLMQVGCTTAEYLKVLPPVNPNAIPVVLGFLPLYHAYGVHVLCLRAPARPATVILMPKWNLDMVLDAIPRYKITTLNIIPSVLHTLLNSPKFQELDLSHVMSVNSGAAYMPPVLSNRMKSLIPKATANEGYGLSEATLSIMGRPAVDGILNGRAIRDPTSIGILNPGMEALILRPDGSHCTPNEPGELYIKGPTVGLGYWNNPKSTAETFLPGGWLKTGDRFRADSRGVFWFEDREKDTLKVSGLQVSPAEIENTILDEPTGLVADVAVAGINLPEARTSDDKCPRAWIVLSEKGRRSVGEDKAREIIDNWAKKNLSRYKWLRGGIEFVDQIPKSPTGKVLRRVLQERYESERQQKESKGQLGKPRAKL